MSKRTQQVEEEGVTLPKNIQQMGQTNGGVKVYLEDYSATWLRRILVVESSKHGILLGRRKVDGNQNYIFIEAVLAVNVEEMDNGWKYNWNEIYEMMQKYFIEDAGDKLEVVGWAMPVEDYKGLDVNALESLHKMNFEGNMTLAFTIDMQEGREQFYILENNRFHSLGGYYIFYEKNKAMQTYVLENQSGPCVETEEIIKGNSESYRSILLKRKEAVKRRYTVSILYAASTFLIMVVMVLAITMMNNYEKMQNMQAVLNDLSKTVINEEVQAQDVVSFPAVGATRSLVAENSGKSEDNVAVAAFSSSVMTESTEASAQAGNSGQFSLQGENAGEFSVQTDKNGERLSQTEQNGELSAQMEQNGELSAQNENNDQLATQTFEPAQGSGQIRKRYEIQPGDTLEKISLKMYNTEQMVDKICQYNDIEDGNQIVAGDVLILP